MWTDWTVLQRVYFIIAMFFSIVLVVQLILMLVGAGHNGDTDLDLNGDGDPDISVDTSDGLALFTLKGLIAFFAIGGWVGFALGDGTLANHWVILISIAAGLVALVLVGLIMKWMTKLADNGAMQISNAIDKTAEVYLTVPANCAGTGKITVEIQGCLTEVEAVTQGEELKTGTKVKVVRVDGDICVVEKLY